MDSEFNLNTSNYAELLKTSGFIDKTLLIQKIFEKKLSRLVITSPPSFGKSVNVDMMKRFLEIQVNEEGNRIFPVESTSNYQLFKMHDLEITEDEEMMNLFGQHPIIHVKCKCDRNIQYSDDMFNFCRNVIHDCFKPHKYLLNSDKLDSRDKSEISRWCDESHLKTIKVECTEMGLSLLASYLNKHFETSKFKVIILIDDYDSPILSALRCRVSNHILNNCIEYYINVISGHSDSSSDIQMVIYTGLFKLHISNDFHEMKHYFKFLCDEEFTPFYGATAEEMDDMLDKFDVHPSLRPEIDRMYGGYRSREGNFKMFNLWSVLNFLKEYLQYKGKKEDFKLQQYWKQSTNNLNFVGLLKYHDIQERVIKLLKGEENVHVRETDKDLVLLIAVEENYSSLDEDELMAYFIQLGYLTYSEEVKEDDKVIHFSKQAAAGDSVDKRGQGDKKPWVRFYEHNLANEEARLNVKELLRSSYCAEYSLSPKSVLKLIDIIGNINSSSPREIFEDFRVTMIELLKKQKQSTMKEDMLNLGLYSILRVSQDELTILKAHDMNKPDLIVLKEKQILNMKITCNKSCEMVVKELVEGKKWELVPKEHELESVVFIGLNVGWTGDKKIKISLVYLCCDLQKADTENVQF